MSVWINVDRNITPIKNLSGLSDINHLSKCATKFDYNDIELEIDEPTYERLKAEGIDELMARHIAHLFIRDTVSLFRFLHFYFLQSETWSG